MILSLSLVSSLLFGITAFSDIEKESFLKQEIVELREENSSTFLTNRGTYIVFCYGSNESHDSNENNDLDLRNNYGPSYISNKSFEIGTGNVDNSLLIVGKSQFINPETGLTSSYQTVFDLSLPFIDTFHMSIRNAGFAIKKQSGQLSNLSAYKVNSPSYSQLNGLSTINKSYISNINLNLSYSFLDITEEIIDSYVVSSNSLTLLFQSSSLNNMCYLYNTSSNNSAPYFFIEYDNYGSARDYFETNGSSNCFGYALYVNSWLEFTNYVPNDFSLIDLEANQSYTITVIKNVLENYFCDNVQYIQSYNSLIDSTQRRIAVRFRLTSGGTYDDDFHFMWQTNTGSWAAKLGSEGFVQSFNINAPEFDYNWLGYYNSRTYYFAIEKN